MPLEKMPIQKLENFLDTLAVIRAFFSLPFKVVYWFFKGDDYYRHIG